MRDLSEGLVPVPASFVVRRLVVALALGTVVSIALVLGLLGPRPDMTSAMATAMFWVKLIYPLSLALVAGLAAERLARPAATAGGRIAWLAAPFAAVALLAAVQFAAAPPWSRHALVMGGSAQLCPFLVLAAALPPLLTLMWSMRSLAPTRLAETGAVVGLTAGGMGAFAYAWHCTEWGAPFLALWYTAGIVGATLLGALLGPLLLRWK